PTSTSAPQTASTSGVAPSTAPKEVHPLAGGLAHLCRNPTDATTGKGRARRTPLRRSFLTRNLTNPTTPPRWHLDNSPKLDRFYFRFPVRLSGSKKMALAPETAMSRRVPLGMIHYIRELASLWRIDPRTDAELLAAFVEAREEAAFTALVIRHGRAVWQVCRRVLANDADAEDAFQATFIALARQAGQLRREALGGWLHKVAHRAALDVAKAARRRAGAHRRLYERTTPASGYALPSDDELRAAVREEMASLPEKLHAALALYYLDGKTQAEVGELLGISDRAVADRLARALDILRGR